MKHLIWLLRDVGAMVLMLDGSELALLYRDADGTVRRVARGQHQ